MIKNITYSKVVPLYNILEIVCKGKADGNPFVDYDIYASITGADNAIVKGFYDGDGIYKVRFMPRKENTLFRFMEAFRMKQQKGPLWWRTQPREIMEW